MTATEKPKHPYYQMDFTEDEHGTTWVQFYDPEGNLVATREIPRQNVSDAIRVNGDNN